MEVSVLLDGLADGGHWMYLACSKDTIDEIVVGMDEEVCARRV
jgi:hypothetical protein